MRTRPQENRMATGESSGPIHPTPTRRSGYRYLFYVKHHGPGGHDGPAKWASEFSHDEEFAVFDSADFHEISDERGWLYGVRISESQQVLALGTWGQQVAEFPQARANEPWHGYPLWPLKQDGPPNRRGEQHRPSKAVFQKMEEVGLISRRDRKRLQKGDHA